MENHAVSRPAEMAEFNMTYLERVRSVTVSKKRSRVLVSRLKGI